MSSLYVLLPAAPITGATEFAYVMSADGRTPGAAGSSRQGVASRPTPGAERSGGPGRQAFAAGRIAGGGLAGHGLGQLGL